jgi:activator of 2-hydroxyglutaryl-CoA dehydratase/predicted nucleotide-binding protein (sugar kinase/HSP70/actin superfamily)
MPWIPKAPIHPVSSRLVPRVADASISRARSAARNFPEATRLFIDAGTRHLRLRACASDGSALFDRVVTSDTDLTALLASPPLEALLAAPQPVPVIITGKLAGAVRESLGRGKHVLPAAAFWMAAQDLIGGAENARVSSLAVIDLSASGYLLIGVDRSGQLKDDLLIVNPRCGAGSGINLDRVLQKLGIAHDQVDPLLDAYLGEAGRSRREQTSVRLDRCGVFATSATISDKNQGIPLDAALATTLKSEVLKALKKLPPGFEKIYLTGRIFRWQYARDCAEDFLRAQGVHDIEYDSENDQVLDSMRSMIERVGPDNLAQPDPRLVKRSPPKEYPSFSELKHRYEASGHYRRLPDEDPKGFKVEALGGRPLVLALDVGSTMAKALLADAENGSALFLEAYSNAGDTIETVKKVFKDLSRLGLKQPSLRGIGITGSARYQVQQALSRIYPALADRIMVLVENYAHARGSIDQARDHIRWLKAHGMSDVNEELCILVDIGGEDTKISTIALQQAELFDNAMNIKCSAGTGSLMDTLSAMFGIGSVAAAQARAYAAPRSFAINATCAVFLMESASKLQTLGVPRDQILASANWAIVENMARTLWNQLDLPRNAVVLLHGQTMLSEPLPLAVTHRLQSYLGGDAYSLLPPQPGHRACIGLVRTLQQAAPAGSEQIDLGDLLQADFEKRVIQCKGAACGDPSARCNRCALRWQGEDGRKIAFTVGGCTAINEILARKGKNKVEQPRDAYKEIWDFVDAHHPRSDDPTRLVIPRSFAVSEWAYLLSRVFERLGIPVYVDNVRDTDLTDAQPEFNVDSCAPHMGAVGQFRRLAGQPHGMILAPQIEKLPTNGQSRGLTCTMNQGGVAVAENLAQLAHAGARFHLFLLSLEHLDPGALSDQLLTRLQPVFDFYGIAPQAKALEKIVAEAIADHLALRAETADFAADLAEQALEEGRQVALVVGREYVLNPGIYDSHIRRLLREKQMTVIPSYVLDLELDLDYAYVYWRNPHVILTLLNAVAHRRLHERLRHRKLRDVFHRIETDPSGMLLPVVQVSTFSCGPDSITAPYVAEIMKQRPFLLLQSDAVLKELAHLENRVNTYVKQLEQGLHAELHIDGEEPFEVRVLNELDAHDPLNRETDLIYLPTISDNRMVTAVIRAAGYDCMENYDDETYDLQSLVKSGRTAAGQAVCAPLAALYADLQRGVEEFVRRKRAGDPMVAGKRRLVLIDAVGPGPCRQGQYPGVHKLLFHRDAHQPSPGATCNALPGNALFQFLWIDESKGYRAGFEEWTMLKTYQGLILKGILHEIRFAGGAGCRDFEEYQRFLADYRELQETLFGLLEAYKGPARTGRKLLELMDGHSWAAVPLKYFLYRMHGREFARPLRRFVTKWIKPQSGTADRLNVLITGEGYMRQAQAEDIFRCLLGSLGFRRFNLHAAPMLSFFELLIEEAATQSRSEMELARAAKQRTPDPAIRHCNDETLREQRRRLRTLRVLRILLRGVLARPLYKASKLHIPPSTKALLETAREFVPTLHPIGELPPYIGETLVKLRDGMDVILNVGPNGCLVSSMSEMMTRPLLDAEGVESGRIQNLFSADGDLNEEVLTLAVLKAMGPQTYYRIPARAPA